MRTNEYLLTIRLTTSKTLDPEAVGRIELKVAELLHNAIWEASGVTEIKANVWGRQGEGNLDATPTLMKHHGPVATMATVPADLLATN